LAWRAPALSLRADLVVALGQARSSDHEQSRDCEGRWVLNRIMAPRSSRPPRMLYYPKLSGSRRDSASREVCASRLIQWSRSPREAQCTR
jgi:hypothetical protein